MRKRLLLILLITCVWALGGCSAAPQAVDPTDIAHLTDIMPYLSVPEKVQTQVAYTSHHFFGGAVFAQLDELQQKRVAELFSALDMELYALIDERQGVSGAPIQYRFEGIGAYCDVTFTRTDDKKTYIHLQYSDDRKLLYRGPDAADVYADLRDIRLEVMRDTTDPDHCGRLSGEGVNAPRTLNKAYTAQAKNILDGSAQKNGKYTGETVSSFDVQLIIGDRTYEFDTSTGVFSKGQDSTADLYQVDESWLPILNAILGVGARS